MYALSLPDTAKLRARLAALRVHPWLLFLAVGLLVWWPQGFNIGPNSSEDWYLLRDHSGSGSLFDAMVTRLFRDIPVWLGTHLTPHGFQGWQSMIMLLAVLRGALMYEVARRMVPMSRHFALACGLLAMFHPADSGYFWLNTTGVQFGLVLALASCVCALMYLDQGRRSQLAWTYVFQFMSSLTYSAFMPLMFAIPVGAWVLQKLRGLKRSPFYLLKVGGSVVLLLLFEFVMVKYGTGRDARAADVDLHEAGGGYLAVARRIVTALSDMGQDFQPLFVLPALAVGAFALWVAWDAGRRQERKETALKAPASWYLAVVLGLLALAVISYLPYSISTARDADRRQLLGAGLFAYSALMFVVFMALRCWAGGWRAPVMVVALVASLVTLSGLEKRSYLVDRYHAVETLLSTLATLAPAPPRHTFFVMNLTDRHQAFDILGIYHRQEPLFVALRYMYGDPSLAAGFYGMDDERAEYTDKGLTVRIHSDLVERQDAASQKANARRKKLHPGKAHDRLLVSYPRMLLVDYPVYQPARLLGPDWLKQRAPTPAAAAAVTYKVPVLAPRPTRRAIMCTMLEPDYRPAYCSAPPVRRVRK